MKLLQLGPQDAGEDIPVFVEKLRDVQEVQEHVQVDVGQGQVGGEVGEMAGVGLDQVRPRPGADCASGSGPR